MQLTYYGHACFSVIMGEKMVLFDPFISPNPLAKDIDISSLNPDFILISHAHQDHMADAIQIAKQSNALIICNYECYLWFGKQEGIGENQVFPINQGGKREFPFGTLRAVDAIHSSSFPDGTYGGNPMGFILEGDDKAFYFAGDTALTMDMQLIPRWANLDLAILPIGDNFTMGYEDAIIAADFVQCNKVLGIHYDTFPPIVIEDKDQVKAAFEKADKELILLEIGESIDF